MTSTDASITRRRVTRVTGDASRSEDDSIAVEAALEIRLASDDGELPVTVTMRTPGGDAELALGFLIAEGVIASAADVEALAHCDPGRNVMRVQLRAGVVPQLASVSRTFAATASCGLCGKTSLDAVLASIPDAVIDCGEARVPARLLCELPDRLRRAQSIFEDTGGLHAVAAFTFDGGLVAVREDVGRHNAFDKLVGARLLAGARDLSNLIVALSGRAGFELLQKAAVARVPIVVAIGAPSSLAVELAERIGITLVGFLKPRGFNVYAHGARLELAS